MSPAVAQFVTRAALRRLLRWRTVKQVTAVTVVLVVSVAAWIYDGSRRPTMPPICGVALPHDPFAVRVFRNIDKGGSWLADLLYAPLPSDQVFVEYLFGTADVIKWFGITFLDPLRASQHWLFGDDAVGVNPYTVAQPCRPAEDCQDDKGTDAGQPWDPKMASMPGIAGTVAAARRYWTGDQLRIAVAVAAAESTHRDITGPTVAGGTMRGRWQINDGAHAQLVASGDWRNPAENARMAHKVWKDAGGSWSPWDAYKNGAYREHLDAADRALGGSVASPAAAVAQTARIVPAGGSGAVPVAAAPAPTPDQPGLTSTPESFTPAPDCTSSAGVGGVTIGTWNTAGKIGNTPDRINAGAGFADLVGLQEIRDNGALRVPGYGVTETDAAVPIIWRTSKLELIEWRREDALSGFAKDKSVVWGIWRNRATGQKFAAVNTHQLVQGGTGWARQAVKVNAVRARLQGQGLRVVLLGDFNASAPKIRDTFGSAGVGHHIDRVVAYGAKPTSAETLSKFGSDHARVRAQFAAPAVPRTPVTAAGAVPRGAEGIKAIAKAHGASPITPHRDPQGGAAFDLMLSGAKNRALGEDLRQRHDELGLRYVISDMRIASPRENWRWRPYSPITSSGDFRHTGHVHVSY